MVEDFHPEVFVKADLKSSSSVANALFTVDFDFTNVTQAIENAKPPDVIAAEEAAKLAKEKAKENALINSAEKLKIAEEVKAAEEAEESERAAAEEGEAEEDDMVCISRRPPLTHNLTHSTPLPPFRRCPTSPTSSRAPPWMVRAAAASPRRRRPRR